jgi:mono/diheme cytochrome c family protein
MTPVDPMFSRALSRIASTCVAAIAIIACGGTLPPPNTQDVKAANTHWPGTSMEQLQSGRRAYLNQCGKCHALKSESAVPRDVWESTVDRMRSKNGAKLSDEDVANIARYLYSMASR